MRPIQLIPVAVAVACVALGLSTPAHAGSTTNTATVTATVNTLCQSLTIGTIAHGTYDPTSATDNAQTGSLTVMCTSTTPFTVAANKGATSGAALTQRLLGSGTNTMNYNLYTTSAHTTVWGDGTGSTSTLSGTGAGIASNVTVNFYSVIPHGQGNVVPGSYSDTVTVTVTY